MNRDNLLALRRLVVIGCGAIGRNVALQLAAIGAPRLQLVDFDTVDETNITTQGYSHEHVGQPKVEALSNELKRINDKIELVISNDRFRPADCQGEAHFCCVDSIDARGAIWSYSKDNSLFFVDGRMLGETLLVYPVCDDRSREFYPTTLFAASEAQQGRCTAKSTIYTANIVSGLMVHQFCRFLRQQPTELELLFNVTASELSVRD